MPLVVFVVAYWKILGVVRRQAKVLASHQGVTSTPEDPAVAGTSEPTISEGQTDNEVGSRGHRRVRGRNRPKILSQAQVNLVQTIIYISVSFILCWMPLYFNLLFKKLTVKQTQFHFIIATCVRDSNMQWWVLESRQLPCLEAPQRSFFAASASPHPRRLLLDMPRNENFDIDNFFGRPPWNSLHTYLVVIWVFWTAELPFTINNTVH